MTAAAVVCAVKDRLFHLVSDEAKLSGSWTKEVDPLISHLTLIENFLKINNSINNDDLAKEAVQVAYDVEDAVESAALHQENMDDDHDARSSKRSSRSSRFKSMINRKSSPSSASTHKAVTNDFHVLKEKMDKILDLIHGRDDAEETVAASSAYDTSHPREEEYVQLQKTNRIVGIEEDFEKLRWFLLNDDDRYSSAATSICGMGGVGKTVLAKKLFDDPSITIRFDSRAWVHVGQDFQARDIAADILVELSSLGNTKEEIRKMETTQLMEQLYKVQKGRRCLVVLDDVWSADAWDTIRFAFPLDHGTKIVITTRIRDVAERASGYIHELKLLSDEQSWELFRIKLGERDDFADPQLEEIGKKIVRQCQGLPLAITVVGGMLRGEKPEDWVKALHVLKERENKNLEPALDILALSYNHLPYELKPCFLYLGHFPPDQVIPVQKLYLLWMAEGLIHSTIDHDHVHKRRMDVAEDYLLALAQRSLVMVQHEVFSGTENVKSCKLHDLINDLCISKGVEEGFFGVVGFEQEKKNLSLMRRTAIYIDMYNAYKDGVSLNISDSKHIRSLIFVERDWSQSKSTWPKEAADLKEFRFVRVLDFDRVSFKVRKLPKGIEKLLYLRYLSFRGCYLDELPSSLTNFPFLETLDLCVTSSCKITIPNILSNFSCLLHLYFPQVYQTATDEKLKLDGLTRLEILENFNSEVCDADDLQNLENLQILTGAVDGSDYDLKKILDFVHGNERLHHSSLTIKSYDCYSNERLSIVTRLLECGSLHALDIEGHLGTLPTDHMGFHFTELVFIGSEFGEDPMPILGKLPNLRILALCDDAFVGTRIVCSEMDFLRLKCLKLLSLCSLAQWVVEYGAMPRLSSLTIEKCKKLEELPEELMDIPTLEEVRIGSMKEEFQEHVRKMAEEQRSLGNDLLDVNFYD